MSYVSREIHKRQYNCTVFATYVSRTGRRINPITTTTTTTTIRNDVRRVTTFCAVVARTDSVTFDQTGDETLRRFPSGLEMGRIGSFSTSVDGCLEVQTKSYISLLYMDKRSICGMDYVSGGTLNPTHFLILAF